MTINEGYVVKKLKDHATQLADIASGIGLNSGAVSPEKTTMFDVIPSKNLINKNDPDFINDAIGPTGYLQSNTSYYCTGYISVEEGQILPFSHNGTDVNMRFVTAYNGSKQVVSSSGVQNAHTYIVPSGISFIRVSFTAAYVSKPQLEVAADGISTAYEDYHELFYVLKKDMQSADNMPDFQVGSEQIENGSVTPEKASFLYGYSLNLFNIGDPDYMAGTYQSVNGTIAANANYYLSGFIKVEFGQSITFSNNGVAIIARYVTAFNSGKSVQSAFGLENVNTYTVPEGVAYIRVTFSTTYTLAMITNDGTVNPYEQYDYKHVIDQTVVKLPSLKKQNNDTPVASEIVSAFLPSEICCAVGRTIEIYNSQVCLQAAKYHFRWNCTVGKAMRRKYSVTGAAGAIGNYTLGLTIYNDSMTALWTGSTTLRVVAALDSDMSVVAIGDSLTNNKPWLAELRSLSGNHITLLGTRGTAPNKHEGRSGWTTGAYLNPGAAETNESTFTYTNPFYNPDHGGAGVGRFDWNYYKTHNGLDPNAVLIYLGTNGMALDPTENAGNIKQIVDYIREADSDITIYVVFTLYRANQNGLGVQTGSDGYTASNAGRWKYEEDAKVFNLMVKVSDLLNGYSALHFVPVSLCHDSEYNFGAVEAPVNPRAAQVEYLPTEGTHPQTQGYYQMADIMFGVISAHVPN